MESTVYPEDDMPSVWWNFKQQKCFEFAIAHYMLVQPCPNSKVFNPYPAGTESG